MIDPAWQWPVVGAMALLFAAAGVAKWRDLRGFVRVLRAYQLLPEAALPLFAIALGSIELVVAVALCVPSARSWSAVLAAALLGLYSVAIAVNLARGRTDFDCGCLGGGYALSPWLLVRNGTLVLLACLLWLSPMAPVLAQGQVPWVLAGVAGLSLAYRLLDHLIARHIELREWLNGDA